MSAITPSHYNGNGPSCIEIIRQLTKEHQNDVYTDYNRYQAFKYIWRAGKKDDVLQDLEKAKTFLQFAIDALNEDRAEETKTVKGKKKND